jgi:hypothetical protein
MVNQAVCSYTPGMENRNKRRAIVSKIIAQLQAVQDNEEICMDNIPENFQESPAYENAENSAAFLRDAIESLEFAY